MSFRSQLIEYMNQVGCSSKDLSLACGLSTSSISRYRSGDRKPPTTSKHIRQIAEGLCKLAREHGIIDFETPNRVTQNLVSSINKSPFIFDYTSFRANFSELVSSLDIDQVAVSRYLGYDDVFVAGLLRGKRQPAEPAMLVDLITEYIVKNHSSDSEKEIIADIIDADTADIESDTDFYNSLHYWLNTTQNDHRRTVSTLLDAIDAYDVSSAKEFFDTDKFKGKPLQNVWPTIPDAEYITDPELFPEAELAFIDSLKDLEPGSSAFIYNDYTFRLLGAGGTERSEKWRYGIGQALKKGVRINLILNIDSPFKTVLANFESWLPYFMTGNLLPYYVKGSQSSIFNHVLLVSDKCAVLGESLMRKFTFGTYCLMSAKDRLDEMKERASLIMEKALPLIEILGQSAIPDLAKRIVRSITDSGNKRAVVTSPPLFLASDSLIDKIIDENNLSEEEQEQIRYYCRAERLNSDVATRNSSIDMSVVKLSKEFFESSRPRLLASALIGKEISYSYEDYCKHLEQAEEYVARKKRFRLTYIKSPYTNIHILVHKGKFVLVTKTNDPVTCLVMKHPKLFKAIESILFPEN
ncbi:MAG: helix-turn-helix transcriptional regulator [Oscillospiraceae bacterium]|nr:helix-turn-helix transcriptional regulator [Oscillospiraceae bacterium]